MRVIDVSMTIAEGMAQWPTDPPVRFERLLDLARGDEATLSSVTLCVHAGTHVDAPSHFVVGAADVDAIPLEVLVGPAQVVDARGVRVLAEDALRTMGIWPSTTRVLFRTDNSEREVLASPFTPDYVALSCDGARWLVRRGVRLVGIDSLSIGPFDGGAATHRVLLGAGIVVVEGLRLAHVTPGPYRLVCLPLRLQGAEGAPARVVLLEEAS